VTLTGIDHRLDGEGHAGLKFEARVRQTVMQHLRVFVVDAPDAVTTVFAHHRKALRLHMLLNGMTHIAERRARTHLPNAEPHGFKGDLDQALRMRGGFAHEIHAARVAVKTVADDRDVDVEDVAVLDLLVARDAVADHVVYRGADGLRKPAVVEVGRGRLLHAGDVLVADAVELVGGHAGFDVLADEVEDFGGEAASLAHFLLFLRGLEGDGHGLGRGGGRGPVRRCFYGRCMV